MERNALYEKRILKVIIIIGKSLVTVCPRLTSFEFFLDFWRMAKDKTEKTIQQPLSWYLYMPHSPTVCVTCSAVKVVCQALCMMLYYEFHWEQLKQHKPNGFTNRMMIWGGHLS